MPKIAPRNPRRFHLILFHWFKIDSSVRVRVSFKARIRVRVRVRARVKG